VCLGAFSGWTTRLSGSPSTALPGKFWGKSFNLVWVDLSLQVSRLLPYLEGMTTTITKRDGTSVPWNINFINRAISLAYFDVLHDGAPNSSRETPKFGLSDEEFAKVETVSARVEALAAATPGLTVERTQDLVEDELLAAGGEFRAIAGSYISYRRGKASLRNSKPVSNGISDYISASKYCRYSPTFSRREVWHEAVNRVRGMHHYHVNECLPSLTVGANVEVNARSSYQDALISMSRPVSHAALDAVLGSSPEQISIASEIDDAFGNRGVEGKLVLPSMRSLQFGGEATLVNHARLYNCAFTHINRKKSFSEVLWLLLSGVGVGFSVQKHHVELLPHILDRSTEDDSPTIFHQVEDTIEGWANALDALMNAYWEGNNIEFDYSLLRKKGATLKISGGRAPGYRPLKKALTRVEAILRGAAGRRLKPIEVYDIIMFIAKAVLSGGVRRSATICLFSHDDQEMREAKTGNWFETNKQRSASNNSAILLRGNGDRAPFDALFNAQRQFGEPGFYFTDDTEHGCNPCVEIGLAPYLDITTDKVLASALARGVTTNDDGVPLSIGDRVSGWQMCNLSTINGRDVRKPEDFYAACRRAAIIGTVQASYTKFGYLQPVSELIVAQEALLGVSICGICDQPGILLDPKVLETGAEVVKLVNARLASALGIQPAARTTCVKPEGTASLLLECASGIHPRHAKRYFRRVQANKLDPVYKFFKGINAPMTEASVYGETDDVITFKVESPEGALTRHDMTAIEFLQKVALVQKHWVEHGTTHEDFNKGLRHNVSNTVTYQPHEAAKVADFIWNNRHSFTGVSLLQASGDHEFPQAPLMEVTTEGDIEMWGQLQYRQVDYKAMVETTDTTTLKDVAACAGGKCDISAVL
jgi:ribonucleoside-triphosphate reductase